MSDLPTSVSTGTTRASAPLLATYWLIVVLPLGWGVYQTVQKSIPLFQVTASGGAAGALSTATATPAQP